MSPAEFVVSIGEPITVPEDVRVVLDCGQLIDDTALDGEVFWYKNGRPIINGIEVNVVVAADKRTIEITDTLRGNPAMIGTEGIYTCEVCDADKTCSNRKTALDVCCKYIHILC